jgi:guanylate kinase
MNMQAQLFQVKSSAPPLLIVLSGPSGVGKDATLNQMKKLGLSFHYVVTTTTRIKRPIETDGVDYNFISENRFKQMISENKFLEWAKVYGNYYGVPFAEISDAFNHGKDVIVKVDVQGAATIKRMLPDSLLIFLTPSSFDELAERLTKRGTHSSAELSLRINKAHEEMEQVTFFDYRIVNQTDNLDLAVLQINAIVNAEKCRVVPRTVKLPDLS